MGSVIHPDPELLLSRIDPQFSLQLLLDAQGSTSFIQRCLYLQAAESDRCIVVSKRVYMLIWTYFVALGFGAAAMLPLSFVYAMSGFSIKVSNFNKLIYECELAGACI